MKQLSLLEMIPKSRIKKYSITRYLYINHKKWPNWYYGKRDIKEKYTIWLNKYYEVLRTINSKTEKAYLE